MSRIIAIVNQKGGVGKTTTAINLASTLAQAGRFVLLVDLDPQGNATSGLGIDYQNIERGLYHSMSGQARLHDITQNTPHQGLRLAPATPDLAGASVELVNEENRERKLAGIISEVQHAYDYIIIDCPPSLGLLTLNGLIAADHILIPVQAEYYALEGLGQLLRTIEMVRAELKPELNVIGAVLTMFDKRNRLSSDVMDELYRYFPDNIFRTVIPRTVRLAEAPSFGQSIFHYDPKGKGSRSYERLGREVMEYFEGNQ
ncbi:MAG: ParA family protein [bacterium]